MSSALLLMLLPSVLLGCVFPLAVAHPKVVVQGHLVSAVTPSGGGEQISLYFCHTKTDRVITSDGDGRFSEELAYFYGGFYMFFPPLGEFPKQTPPPPNICVMFPSEPGQYYSITLNRESTSWRMLDIKTENGVDKPVFVPVLVKADSEELNKRGSLNDWVLRLQFTK